MNFCIGRNAVALIYGGKLMGFDSLPLPPMALRFQFSDPDYDPTTVTSWVDPYGITRSWLTGSYWVKVQGTTENRWDWYYDDPNWSYAFEGAFRDSDNMVQVIAGNTSDVHNMMNIFEASKSLTSICWLDMSNVTSMRYMFYDCTSLTTVPLFDTGNVKNMAAMFGGCVSLSNAPAFNTQKVESMASMFSGCRSLTSVPLFDTHNVYNMQDMLYGCSQLSTVPMFDTSNVRYMDGICWYCSSLRSVPLWNTSKVEYMRSAFAECPNVESGALALYQQASSQEYPPRYHEHAFKNCGSNTASGRADLLGIPQDWQ